MTYSRVEGSILEIKYGLKQFNHALLEVGYDLLRAEYLLLKISMTH
jgi:hypothetical protein